MKQYRKKPVVVEAVQLLDYSQAAPIIDWSSGIVNWNSDSLTCSTLEGELCISEGDWVIKGVAGEFYPCKPEIFEQTYEEVQ